MAVKNNYNTVKAAYDSLVAAKDRALRNNEIQKAQTLKGIDRRILQNGITSGHQETTDLRARSAFNQSAVNIGAKYDPDIANLYAQIKALQPKSSGGGKRGSLTEEHIEKLMPVTTRRRDNSLIAGKTATPSINKYIRMTH